MPRVLSDVSRIEDVLRNIETEMKSLAVQLRTFDLRNVAGVEDLSRLDTLKNNMEQVCSSFFSSLEFLLQPFPLGSHQSFSSLICLLSSLLLPTVSLSVHIQFHLVEVE